MRGIIIVDIKPFEFSNVLELIINMKHIDEHMVNEPGLPSKETGYMVPEGYFDSFGDRLKLRMEAERLLPARRGILFYLKPALGLAAGLAIVLTVFLYSGDNQEELYFANTQNGGSLSGDEQSDQISNTLATQISEVQFFSALADMDEYDASKMPKDELADYLASNCTDLEILIANK